MLNYDVIINNPQLSMAYNNNFFPPHIIHQLLRDGCRLAVALFRVSFHARIQTEGIAPVQDMPFQWQR